jgi:UDP-N-acetylmuramyl-tripeptide synthetase
MSTPNVKHPLIELTSPQQAADWLRAQGCLSLCSDSRRVNASTGFIAWPGAASDARRFVSPALAQGAPACIVESDGAEAFDFYQTLIPVARYAGLKAASGDIAAAFYGKPSLTLKILAITGTNGKSSSAWWLAQALNHLQAPCAVVGTLGIGVPPALVHNGLTTPDPVLLQAEFSRMVATGLRYCAIEASSIGLAEQRLSGTAIHSALFTNFTQDHLDYHGSMSAYWQAKQSLFDAPHLQHAIVNLDDSQGRVLLQHLQTQRPNVKCWTFAIDELPAPLTITHHLQAKHIVQSASGLQFEVHEGTNKATLQTHFVGRYNVSNLLGVIAVLRSLGFGLSEAVKACEQLTDVPGRMESVGIANETTAADTGTALPRVVVDYAHTPDALEKALLALQPLAAQRGGQLHVVFGCGGERDAAKRPLMGAIAAQLADHTWLTSDNPRKESPLEIIQDVLAGMETQRKDIAGISRHHVEVDRSKAIAQAIAAASSLDVVLIAGKGHEDYQDIAGVKRPFSDQQTARLALQQRRLNSAPGAKP